MPKALFLLGYDAYVRPAHNMVACLKAQAWSYDAYHLDLGNNPLSDKQKQPFPQLPTLTLEALKSYANKHDYEFIFLGFGGRSVKRLITTCRSIFPQSKIVTFFPGICWSDTDNGLLVRSESDLVLCNTRDDLAFYNELGQIYGFDVQNGRVLGYPQIFEVQKRAPICSFSEIRTITYFDQNIIPQSFKERTLLAERLVALAQHFPDKKVCIKMRNSAAETTAHTGKNNLDDLLREHGELPANMFFSCDDILTCMDKTDLALSMTSTVLLETMARGIPTYALADFGVRQQYGTPYFMGSGILKSFADVHQEVLAYPDPEWLKWKAPALHMESIFSLPPEKRLSKPSHALKSYFIQRDARRTRNETSKPSLMMRIIESTKTILARVH